MGSPYKIPRVLASWAAKNMAHCSQEKVVETNCSKNKEREAKCSKEKVVEINCSKSKEGVAKCSKEKVVEINCSNNKEREAKCSKEKVHFEWQAGKHNLIANALSRFPVSPEEPMDSAEMEEDRAFIRRTITSNDCGLEWLCDTADEDPTYQEIVKAKCNRSSVNHLPIDHPARAFRNVWEFISMEEGFGFSPPHLRRHPHYCTTLSTLSRPRPPPHPSRRPGQDEESRPAAVLLAGDERHHP